MDFTPQFLTSILLGAGFSSAFVKTVRTERILGKKRFNADVMRLHLSYEVEPSAAPRTLIAKLPTANSELNPRARIFQPGLREGWFYRSAAGLSDISVPGCYYSEADKESGQSILLLEDISPAHGSTWQQGISTTVARLALNSAARLHARWWNRGEISEIKTLTTAMQGSILSGQQLVQELYDAAWPKFIQQFREIPARVRRFGDAIVGNMKAVDGLLDRSPKTLAHGDFRIDNFLFTSHEGEFTCWVIDWEDVQINSGLLDIAWLLGGCLPVKESDAEASLLEYYYLKLVSAGVAAYSWEQCLDDYTRSMVTGFVQGVISSALEKGANGYERKLATTVGRRFIRAAERLRLYELIESIG